MPPATLPPDLEHKYAEINGIRMHYVEAGRGDDLILFLHGFPESWYSWRHQIAHFADRYRVVAPDQRGYNLTDARGPYDTGTLQQDVLQLIDHLGAERVHLVGHDWGAVVAWLIGMNQPERLKTLTICNVPHPAIMARALRSNVRQMLRSWYVLFFQIPWLPEKVLAAQNYQMLARMIIRDTHAGTFTREDVMEMLTTWRRHGLGGGINWYRALFRNRPEEATSPVPLVLTPTLMIWGEADRALGKELSYGTDEFVKDLRVEYLPNTSHWVQQEEPGRVNALIDAHLQAAGGT